MFIIKRLGIWGLLDKKYLQELFTTIRIYICARF